MFEITTLSKGKIWEYKGENFRAKIYVPDNSLRGDILNFGYMMPYLIVLEENQLSFEEAEAFAEKKGLSKIAADHDGSVVFVYPTNPEGWEGATTELFCELIAHSKIGQFYKDGVLISKDFWGQKEDEYYIRGAIFRTMLFGYGASADYIASKLLTSVMGQYLWGPGEITPTAVSLERLSVMPSVCRGDIPVLSVNNTEEINNELAEKCNTLCIVDENSQDKPYEAELKDFYLPYIRWCGNLVPDPDFEQLGVMEEYGIEKVHTSPENNGEYKGTSEHPAGYFAWYNKGLLEKGPVPAVLIFHGGGDSAQHIAKASGWWEVAHKYDFLLIAVENHLNLTATETIELLRKLQDKYPIDERRIYASGFSMGGCKTWDMVQEYPAIFAAVAPMDATFEVGLNVYGQPAPVVNHDKMIPIFYSGGEITPLPELPFQAEKCWDRMRYVFEINQLKKQYDVAFEKQDSWENPIWGISGDETKKVEDSSRGSCLTLEYFVSRDGITRTVFGSISGQGHECRQHTCEMAYLFMSGFTK